MVSQTNLLLETTFRKEQINPYLDFYHDFSKNETIETIQLKNFNSFKGKNFPGLYKEKFWFRLDLTNNTNEILNLFFKIKAYAFYKNIRVYKVSNTIITDVDFDFKVFKRKFDIPINLKAKENLKYYFEVNFVKAVSFPIQLITEEENKVNFVNETLLQGVYYGFTFLVLLFNFFFFVYTKNNFFLYYCLFQLGIVASIAFLDGIIYQILGRGSITKFINILFNMMLAGGSILFLSSALNLKNKFPLFKYITGSLFLICIILFSMYIYTYNSYWSGLGKASYLSILLICFLTSIYFARKNAYAKFFFFAFGILFTCHILFILPTIYGLKDFGFTEWHYKIGSAIEMILFLTAIPYRHKSLAKEKDIIEKELVSYKEQLLEKSQKTKLNIDQKLKSFSTKFNLTIREIEILTHITEGENNKKIAEKVFLTESTVKYHCSKLYSKTETKNRTQLILLFNTQ